MINWKLIYKVLGQLLFIEASLLLLSLLVAVYYQQEDIFAFIVATLTTIGGGLILKWRGHGADNSMSRRDAYLVVSLSWIIFSLFGTLPFMVSGYINHFTDAYFETMSGFTTTGATILDDVECFPHGLLFWRSLTQWIGGLGIVFFTIALLPSLVGGQTKVFAAEATGPIKTKLHPRISTSAKWIWSIYLMLTIACILSYYVAGMGLFDSFNYAMTTTATGGFSTHNTSTEFFHSPSLEYICTFFCFLSGVNFTLLYAAVIKFKIKELFRNSEFRFYIFLVTVFSIFIMVELIVMRNYDIEHAFRSAIFQVVSFITTTGLFNDDAALWPHVTWVVLSMCMFIGACSGSTSGGLKCIRGVILLRMVKNEFRQILHPNAQDRRGERAHAETRHAAGFPHHLSHHLRHHLVHDDSDGNRQHQCHHHHAELRGKRRTNLGNRDWTHHVVERTARSGQVVLFAHDAHRPSGNLYRTRDLHTSLLEGELGGGKENGKKVKR